MKPATEAALKEAAAVSKADTYAPWRSMANRAIGELEVAEMAAFLERIHAK